jgi:hypothetical protein
MKGTSKMSVSQSRFLNLPCKPASLDLADHVGKLLVFAKGEKLATAQRIYSNMTPEAKARADFARSWLYIEGGVQS